MPYIEHRLQTPCDAGCGRRTRRPSGTCSICAGEKNPPIRPEKVDTAALVEDAEWLARTGETLNGALPRLGVTEHVLNTHLTAAERADILEQLRRNRQGVNV